MKRILIILSLTNAVYSQVVCDTFQVNWSFEGNNLKMVLKTDLPENTDLIVTVDRLYLLKENQEEYGIDYYYEKSKVKDWSKPKNILIDNLKWENSFQEKLKQHVLFQQGTRAEKINDFIGVRFLVPIRQTNSAFGEKNKNLTGEKVSVEFLRIVEDAFQIQFPYKASSDPPLFANPTNLKKQKTYILSKRTPFMSELLPSDTDSALQTSIWLEPGFMIKIIKNQKKNNRVWYFAQASFQDGVIIGDGWINSNALTGQSIQLKIK